MCGIYTQTIVQSTNCMGSSYIRDVLTIYMYGKVKRLSCRELV